MTNLRKALLLTLLLSLGMWAVSAQTPLTPAANLAVKADSSGNLMTAYATMTGSAGPLTPLANIRVRADSSGNLLVTSTAGTTVTPDTICMNTANQDVCFQRQAAGVLNLTTALAGTTFTRVNFGTALAGNPALKANGAILQVRLADDSGAGTLNSGTLSYSSSLSMGGSPTLLISTAVPTISSGFGTSPSVTSSNGTSNFRINVGTGGVATSGVVATNVTATTGWNCVAVDMTNNTVTRETSSTTTTFTLTAAAAWAASDILLVQCLAY